MHGTPLADWDLWLTRRGETGGGGGELRGEEDVGQGQGARHRFPRGEWKYSSPVMVWEGGTGHQECPQSV